MACGPRSPTLRMPEGVDMANRIPRAASPRSEVRVLLENGEYWLNNRGDLAILDVTVRRFAERWPDARIGVLTSAPALLRAYESRVDPICYQRGGNWPRWRRRPGPMSRIGPEVAGVPMNGWDAAVALPGRVARRVWRVVVLRLVGGPRPAVRRDRRPRPAARTGLVDRGGRQQRRLPAAARGRGRHPVPGHRTVASSN